MLTLYSMQRSGNSYKVRLALAHLGVPYRLVEVDILKGESRTPEFLAKNPNGQVPLLEVASGRYLAESNAILWHLVSGTPLRPADRIDRARALQWMFFEQHSLEPNIGAAYFWLTLVKGGRELQQHALEDWMEEGYRALGVMENHLKQNRYFAADRYTVADIRSRPSDFGGPVIADRGEPVPRHAQRTAPPVGDRDVAQRREHLVHGGDDLVVDLGVHVEARVHF